ncbi:MAG: carboxypeptidase-like regulatory domain-containing protein [Planctomycetota bacterium]|jgi:hypothetical protein
MARRRPKRRLLVLLAILLFFLLFKFNPFLAGVLPGGGRWKDEPEHAVRQGTVEILVVRHNDRKPVAGATIHVENVRGKRETRKTDEKGHARFGGLAAEPVRIAAEGEGGFATAWSKPGRRVEMQLDARPLRTGQVVDGEGESRPGMVHLLDRDARILASAKTDPQGRYELPDHPDSVAVCAWPEKGAPSSSAFGDIVVGEGLEHAGESFEQGVAEIEIYALVPDSMADRMVPLRVRWPLDDKGYYKGRLPMGAQAWVFHGSYALPLGEIHTIAHMQLPKGKVVDENDQPLAGVSVVARALSRGLPVSPNPFPIETRTGAGGEYDLGWGPHTRYELELSAPGRARIMLPAPRDGAPIRMPPGYRIGGRVVDDDSEPVALARVTALPTPDPNTRYVEARVASTDDGHFYLEGLGGEYSRVQVFKRGYKPATLDRVPPEGFVTIRLRKE